MGEVKGFLKYDRIENSKEISSERIKHYNEFVKPLSEAELSSQGARCMDCGVPFCQSGCPVDNLIPEWNDLVFQNKWEDAAVRLLSTNNFPEFTGRVCPAPCEDSCVVSINKPAVTIKSIEKAIIEKAFELGFVKPNPPSIRTDKKIAIVGSGPSGLAAAEQLNRFGHSVTVFEKNEVLGGLLSLGIPDFKLEKNIVERRINLMKAEGINFITNTCIGIDVKMSELKKQFDSILLCGGAERPRDLLVEGRELEGIHFAMDFLTQQNRRNGNRIFEQNDIIATGKRVVIIGGGDTGSDCIGTAIRQKAKSVVNIELMPKPPNERTTYNQWPEWANIERSSSSHEEGCEREFAVATKAFIGKDGKIEKIKLVRLNFTPLDPSTGRKEMVEIPNSEFELEADLVILALGFLGPNIHGMFDENDIITDKRSNVQTNEKYMTNTDGIFASGDMRIGQSIVVRAINEGRNAADSIHDYLTNPN